MEPMLPSPQPEHLEPIQDVQTHPDNLVETAPNTRQELSKETLSQTVTQPVPQDHKQVNDQGVGNGFSDNVVVSNTTDSPLIADDVDVIEKEWVDKAKKL